MRESTILSEIFEKATRPSSWTGVFQVPHLELTRLKKALAAVACIGFGMLVCGCGGTSNPRPQPTNSFLERTPCPLVTDADLAELNPVLKRAGDDWWKHNESIFCEISFGVDMLTVSGNNVKPFELLEVSEKRNSDFPKEQRPPRDLCADPGYARIGECIPLPGVGDYAFYLKTLGKVYMFKGTGYHAMPHEIVWAISGPYEIRVDAGYWKGGSPKKGAIELAKKLAAQYR